MPTRLRKIRRQRATRYMGWGQVGQHRASGRRGGKGHTGFLKHKWTWTVKYDPSMFGKTGFRNPTSFIVKKWINVGNIDKFYLDMIKNNKINNDKKKVDNVINLNELGFDKLLGKGSITKKYKIIIAKTTNLAKKKIEKAGGEVITG